MKQKKLLILTNVFCINIFELWNTYNYYYIMNYIHFYHSASI